MKICVETQVAAQVEEVWIAWTSPDEIRQWNAAFPFGAGATVLSDCHLSSTRSIAETGAPRVNKRRCHGLLLLDGICADAQLQTQKPVYLGKFTKNEVIALKIRQTT